MPLMRRRLPLVILVLRTVALYDWDKRVVRMFMMMCPALAVVCHRHPHPV